jgi:hypothetical protein
LLAKGRITLTSTHTGKPDFVAQSVTIKQYDVFHSLLGEMKPGSISEHTKGGHLFIAELKAIALELKEFKELEHGFFDILVKRGSNKQPKTFYPLGTTPEQTVESLEKCIKNAQSISLTSEENIIKCFIENAEGQKFRLYVDANNIAKFHPSA